MLQNVIVTATKVFLFLWFVDKRIVIFLYKQHANYNDNNA